MNKQIIFEGTVNGQKYDTVEDYNKAIKEALSTGRCDAYSQTRTVETHETTEEDKLVIPTPGAVVTYDLNGDVANVNLEFLDDFNTDFVRKSDSIDDMMSNFDKYQEEITQKLSEHLKGYCIPYVKRALKNKDFENQLEGYADDIEHIQDSLNKATDNIAEKINTLQQKIDVLQMKQDLIDTYTAFYNELYNGVIESGREEKKGVDVTKLNNKKIEELATGFAKLLEKIFE